jgi:hypothetical protein
MKERMGAGGYNTHALPLQTAKPFLKLIINKLKGNFRPSMEPEGSLPISQYAAINLYRECN